MEALDKHSVIQVCDTCLSKNGKEKIYVCLNKIRLIDVTVIFCVASIKGTTEGLDPGPLGPDGSRLRRIPLSFLRKKEMATRKFMFMTGDIRMDSYSLRSHGTSPCSQVFIVHYCCLMSLFIINSTCHHH